MRKIAFTLATIVGAINLIGCQGTSNNSTPSTPVATSCTTNAYGQSVNTSTGMPCTSNSYCGTGYNSNPYQYGGYNQQYGYQCQGYGTYGGTGSTGYGMGGCQYWSTVYPGTQYVPMIDPSSGQLVCINVSSYGVSVPQGYNYSQPVYVVQQCSYYGDPTCYGGQWQGYGSYGGYGGYSGGGTCLGIGGDYGMLGLCF